MEIANTHIWGLKWSKLFLSLHPSSKQQDTLISCVNAVRSAVRKDRLEDLNTADVMHVGALAKQTLSKGTNEIDVMVCFSSSVTATNLSNYLHMLRVSWNVKSKILKSVNTKFIFLEMYYRSFYNSN